MSNKLNSIGAKLKSKFPTDTHKKRLKRACSTAINGLEATLRIVKEAAGAVGPPGLQAGIGGVLFVLSVVKKSFQNAEDIEKLAQRIEGLTAVLQNSQDGGTLSETIIHRIDHLAIKWSTVADEVRSIASRHAVKRLIHYCDDAQAISDHVQTISWAIESFTVETMLAIEFALDEQGHTVNRIEGKMDDLGEKVVGGFQRVHAKSDIRDGHPPHATFAAFDCKDRAMCLEGTRLGVLEQIFRWIDLEDCRLEDGIGLGESDSGIAETATENLRIFWINGSAGTGKTTIANTIAEACRKRRILGASFFCSRDDAECNSPNLIFTTIAYQLAIFFPPFRAEVVQALRSNPDIGYSSVAYQLEELIIKPLRAVRKSFPSCVIVLDALDECKNSDATSIILSSLSRHVTQLSPLKILVTSRPERHITNGFKSGELRPERLILHEIELEAVQNDIAQYFNSNLALIRESYKLERSWPSASDVQSLVQLSSGLFIFAATSVKFIDDRNYCNPRGQLADLLHNTPTVAASSSSPHHYLDQLYTQVLTHAFPNISPYLAGRFRLIIGTIVLLQDPLSSLALELLLNLGPNTVQETLVHLHSIIIVPEDELQVIRLLHPSFFDFIANPTRCRNPRFVINMTTQHTLLARVCLGAMKVLKRDVCDIKDPSILNNEVEDLSTRIMKYIPPHLQYACRHWAFHFTHAMISDDLLDLLKEFITKYMLYWVEACSLLGELRNALLALDQAQQAIHNMGKDMTDAKHLLHDFERFTREFFQVLATSSLQIYHSALLFAPTETLLKKTYGHELLFPMKLYNTPEMTWNSCVRTMDGHTATVHSVAFSPDGACIVSGSSDHTLRLWDTVSGAHLNTLLGHSNAIRAVAFSPDGTRIVSGSDDGALQLWDAINAAHLTTLNGHANIVYSVAFSPDGTRIVSGSYDNTLRLWDAVRSVHLNTLAGHSNYVASVAFSPDNLRVVSGANDSTLRLWDAVSGAHLQTLMGHFDCVNAVAFSNDVTRVISASSDKTIRLWDAVTFAHLNTFMGHSDAVLCVAFSPDDTRIVSGSEGNTLRLWDAFSGTHLQTFTGHSQAVWSVAVSPDGMRIVSGSQDDTLRLWDAVSDVGLNTRNKQSHQVSFVAFSPDGTHVVSIGDDNTLRLWSSTGTYLHTLTGHSDKICSVAFSSDSMRLVSASEDGTLRLWDVVSGGHINTLIGHSDYVRSVAFSPDSTRIVSGSDDLTLRLWDSVSGAHLITLMGHSDWVWAVAFSPDGRCVMSGSDDTTVCLWDANSGAHLKTLEAHSAMVRVVAFSPDGTRVASGSCDQTIQLWDAVSGTHLHTLAGHSGWVMSVAFSPDSTHVVSGSLDGTIRLWNTNGGMHLDTCTFTGDPEIAISLAHCLDSSQLPYSLTAGYIMQDEWICSFPRRRLCWLPVSCRPYRMAFRGNCVVLGTRDGRVLFIDFTGIDSYLHSPCSM